MRCFNKIALGIILLISVGFAPGMLEVTNKTTVPAQPTQTFFTNQPVWADGRTLLCENFSTDSTSHGMVVWQNRDVSVLIVRDTGAVLADGVDLSGLKVAQTTATTDQTGSFLSIAWNQPTQVGTYDAVIDFGNDERLDLTPVNVPVNGETWKCEDIIHTNNQAQDNGVGFTVLQSPIPVGNASAESGTQIPDHTSTNTGGSGGASDTYNEMLSIKIVASAVEDVRVNSFTLKASGTGDDANEVATVAVGADTNTNANLDDGELLASGKYSADDGTLTLTVPGGYTVHAGQTVYFVFGYQLGPNFPLPGKTFQFTLQSVSAAGVSSGTNIDISGLPKTSAKKTVGTMTTQVGVGQGSPGDHTQQATETSPGQGLPFNKMLIFALSASNTDNVTLNSITLKHKTLVASATPDKVSQIILALDHNNDGAYDPAYNLSVGTYDAAGNAVLTIQNGYKILRGKSANFIIGYVLSGDVIGGEKYQFQLTAVSAVYSNGNAVNVNGLPIDSAVKTIISQPVVQVCTGNVTLDLNPNNVTTGARVDANVSGLSNCENKTVTVKKYSCSSNYVACTAAIDSQGTASCNFTAPTLGGEYQYFACLDKNEDNDVEDLGEQNFDTLFVTPPEENCDSNECGACPSQQKCETAGCSWTGYCVPTNLKPDKCLEGNCEDCQSELRCETVGCFWYDDACHYRQTEQCGGTLSLSIVPTQASEKQNVSALTSGLRNCVSKTVEVRKTAAAACSGQVVASCEVTDTGCVATFLAPTKGNYSYQACLDANSDGEFSAGEYATAALEVKAGTVAGTKTSLPDWVFYIIVVIALGAGVFLFWWLGFRKKPEQQKAAPEQFSEEEPVEEPPAE